MSDESTGRASARRAPRRRRADGDDEQFRPILEAAGFRYTRQRGAIYSYLREVGGHPTAEEVYHSVRARIPRLSLATVYNTLEALVDAGLAHRLAYGGGSARYDCRIDPHYHLRDLASARVCDLPADYDPKLLDKLDPSLVDSLADEGFRVTGYRLEVLGYYE